MVEITAEQIRKAECFTIDKIREAFIEIFHEAGELWFNYLGDEEENKDSTVGSWMQFYEELLGRCLTDEEVKEEYSVEYPKRRR